MPRRGLTPEVALDVHLSAICTRNQYDHDPAPVIAELRAVAGARGDILAQVAGRFAGFYDSEHTHALCAALVAQIEGADAWVGLGRQRRGQGPHNTSGHVRDVGG